MCDCGCNIYNKPINHELKKIICDLVYKLSFKKICLKWCK